MKQVIDGLLYDTETATLIADDRFWDGHNWERHGRNTSLYKTKKGAYFLEHTTFWQGERDHLEAILRMKLCGILSGCHVGKWNESAFGIAPMEA